jgi:hypothetical protein
MKHQNCFQVYQVFDSTCETVLAIKVVDLSQTDEVIRNGYINEIKLLQKLQTSNKVVKMYD